jgi:hypothetical protein
MKTIEIGISGTRPLLIHNAERLVNPFDPSNKEKTSLARKRGKDKTEEVLLRIAWLEWEMSWYWDQVYGPYLPAQMMWASIHAAAKKTSDGGYIRDGLTDASEDGKLPLIYEGPRTLDKLWGAGLEGSPYVDYRPTGQQRVKIMRCRPKLHKWALTSLWQVDDTVLDIDKFQTIVDRAGAIAGLGDFRLRYGRFQVSTFKVVD